MMATDIEISLGKKGRGYVGNCTNEFVSCSNDRWLYGRKVKIVQ